MRIPSWLALAAVLVPTAAGADDHRADVYGGFSFSHGSKLWGLHESYAVTVLPPSDLSLAGDLSVHFGSQGGNDVTRVTYLFGPRWTLDTRATKHKVLAHVLLGGVYTNNGTPDTKDFAVAFGGGWEFISRPAAAGTSSEGLGFRVQADYVVTAGDNDDFPRVSAGIMYRFRK